MNLEELKERIGGDKADKELLYFLSSMLASYKNAHTGIHFDLAGITKEDQKKEIEAITEYLSQLIGT